MQISVSDYIVQTLIHHQVKTVFGVISIHNLPIADAIGQSQAIHFIPARGEAGGAAMADSYARLNGLGVVLTSTGAGAGNAVGALLEAFNASSPLLHITGQVETPYLDRIAGFIHETKDQLGFLKASCKQAYRVMRAEDIQSVLAQAITAATTWPQGPVSVEIPIDLQLAKFTPTTLKTATTLPISVDMTQVQVLINCLDQAKRPLIWVGGGARHCRDEITALADLGIAVVSSTHGRGILSDHHPRSLRAHHNHAAVQTLLQQADLLLVIGSKLRSNETASYSLSLGQKIIQIDVDGDALHRNYHVDIFLENEAKALLQALLRKLNRNWLSSEYDHTVANAVQQATQDLRLAVANYAQLNDFVSVLLGQQGIFVRDITISGSTWGSRLLEMDQPKTNLHSLAGAIGLGLPHAIGAAIAQPQRKVVLVVGDGGIALNIGELATVAQEQLNICIIVMNDGGYGVMRGIQDRYFSGRQYYNQLYAPSFTALAQSYDISSARINDKSELPALLEQLQTWNKPFLIEVIMSTFGELKFAGPPQKKLY